MIQVKAIKNNMERRKKIKKQDRKANGLEEKSKNYESTKEVYIKNRHFLKMYRLLTWFTEQKSKWETYKKWNNKKGHKIIYESNKMK